MITTTFHPMAFLVFHIPKKPLLHWQSLKKFSLNSHVFPTSFLLLPYANSFQNPDDFSVSQFAAGDLKKGTEWQQSL